MDKFTILIPDNNIEERRYIVDVLLKDFLGLVYEVKTVVQSDVYVMQFGQKEIEIQDSFFSLFDDPLSYLHVDHLPDKVIWLDTSLFNTQKVPILYGNNLLQIDKDRIICGADIFASAFFMLTRWEEIVIKEKDPFGRCQEESMFVVKYNLYKRAIVNEYCEFLKNMIRYFIPDIKYTVFNSTAYITHDIDNLFRYGSCKSVIRNLLGDILLRKSLKAFTETCLNYIRFIRGKVRDPFDTFDYLMDESHPYGFRNAFYFIPLIRGEESSTYDIFDPRVYMIIGKIIEKGYEVGLHASKLSFHNYEHFQKEYERLSSISEKIRGGRQHYLLYDVQDSFAFWNNISGLEYDCGLGFHHRIGFRCGCCFEYRMFDVCKRSKLRIRERPLLVMDTAVLREIRDRDNVEKEMFNLISQIIDVVKRFGGSFVFLWHNDNFNRYEAKKYNMVYSEVLKYLKYSKYE